jgi:hypothetical protein
MVLCSPVVAEMAALVEHELLSPVGVAERVPLIRQPGVRQHAQQLRRRHHNRHIRITRSLKPLAGIGYPRLCGRAGQSGKSGLCRLQKCRQPLPNRVYRANPATIWCALRAGLCQASRMTSGRSDLVLLHGLGRSGESQWREVVPFLADHHQVYAPTEPLLRVESDSALRLPRRRGRTGSRTDPSPIHSGQSVGVATEQSRQPRSGGCSSIRYRRAPLKRRRIARSSQSAPKDS